MGVDATQHTRHAIHMPHHTCKGKPSVSTTRHNQGNTLDKQYCKNWERLRVNPRCVISHSCEIVKPQLHLTYLTHKMLWLLQSTPLHVVSVFVLHLVGAYPTRLP